MPSKDINGTGLSGPVVQTLISLTHSYSADAMKNFEAAVTATTSRQHHHPLRRLAQSSDLRSQAGVAADFVPAESVAPEDGSYASSTDGMKCGDNIVSDRYFGLRGGYGHPKRVSYTVTQEESQKASHNRHLTPLEMSATVMTKDKAEAISHWIEKANAKDRDVSIPILAQTVSTEERSAGVPKYKVSDSEQSGATRETSFKVKVEDKAEQFGNHEEKNDMPKGTLKPARSSSSPRVDAQAEAPAPTVPLHEHYSLTRFIHESHNAPLDILNSPPVLQEPQVSGYPGFVEAEHALIQGSWGRPSFLPPPSIEPTLSGSEGGDAQPDAAVREVSEKDNLTSLEKQEADANYGNETCCSDIRTSLMDSGLNEKIKNKATCNQSVHHRNESGLLQGRMPDLSPPIKQNPTVEDMEPHKRKPPAMEPVASHVAHVIEESLPVPDTTVLNSQQFENRFTALRLHTPPLQEAPIHTPISKRRGTQHLSIQPPMPRALNPTNPVVAAAESDDEHIYTLAGLICALAKLYSPSAIPHDIIRALPDPELLETLSDENSPVYSAFRQKMKMVQELSRAISEQKQQSEQHREQIPQDMFFPSNKKRSPPPAIGPMANGLSLAPKDIAYLRFFMEHTTARLSSVETQILHLRTENSDLAIELGDAEDAVREVLHERLGFESSADRVILRWKKLEREVREMTAAGNKAVTSPQGHSPRGRTMEFLARELGKDIGGLVETVRVQKIEQETKMRMAIQKERDDCAYWKARAAAAEERMRRCSGME